MDVGTALSLVDDLIELHLLSSIKSNRSRPFVAPNRPTRPNTKYLLPTSDRFTDANVTSFSRLLFDVARDQVIVGASTGSPVSLVVKAMDRQSGDGGFDSRSGRGHFLDSLGIVYHCTCLTIYKFMQWQAKKAHQLKTVEVL
ncbi:hypothetical protein RP20_CCG012335 [Aedes albopictus]|nr:hypothetical protein RP20_CCG012335 [Aedes albopictus]